MTNNPGDPFEVKRQMDLRLEIIRFLAVAIFVALGARLYWLQVKNYESYREQADSNRYKTIPIPARRGRILDRNGKLLVDSRYAYNIVLERKLGKREVTPKQFPEVQKLLTDNLDIEPAWLAKRFEAAIYAPKHIPIVVKEDASSREVQWVAAHQNEYPEIRVERAPQRHYLYGGLAAHAIGYVGEVSLAQLNNPNGQYSQEKGFKFGDIVGQAGLERYYNGVLTGRDGWRKVIVNSLGKIEDEVDKSEPIPGRDVYTTLDFDLQQEAEKQGDSMPAGRGAIGMMDPNNGEIFVFVSRPSFDPNTFSQRAKTQEGREEIVEYYQDENRPLYNRMIQGGFVPGSTWKLMTSVAALNEGVITPKDSRIQDGGIQLGSYFMNSMSHSGMPDVVTAITISADGYYYRLGLKMGEARFAKWVEKFGFGHRTGIDLPHEDPGLPPTAATKQKTYEAISKRKLKEAESAPTPEAKKRLVYQAEQILRDAKWTDYDMAASAFGQGQNKSTPVQLMRYVAGLANGGKMHTPHLLLKAVAGTDRNDVPQPELRYEEKGFFTVPMSPEIHDIVKRGMFGAVNVGGGTGAGSRIEGFDVCGKTGTAQVASNERAGSKNKDHAWFISFAPRDKPEICGVVLTENAGFGGKQSAPRAKAIYDIYYRRKTGLPVDAQAQLIKTP
ncbi:MAG: penicillin-binding protein 2 [Acidobacteria bacterium]|nr:penicillin-binding protein 2 [Acidobacteriota bacterium]